MAYIRRLVAAVCQEECRLPKFGEWHRRPHQKKIVHVGRERKKKFGTVGRRKKKLSVDGALRRKKKFVNAAMQSKIFVSFVTRQFFFFFCSVAVRPAHRNFFFWFRPTRPKTFFATDLIKLFFFVPTRGGDCNEECSALLFYAEWTSASAWMPELATCSTYRPTFGAND
jgi:hypothetical protein